MPAVHSAQKLLIVRLMTLVTFAIPQESRAFVAARRRSGLARGEEITVAHTGIGLSAASRSVRGLLEKHAPAALVSAGFAGALEPRLRVGDVLVATNHSAAEWVQRCQELWKADTRVFFAELTTSEHAIASAAEKAALFRTTGAAAVDMETSAIAEACSGAGVPMLALRVISDTAHTALPLPFDVSYDLIRQRPRPAAVAYYLLRHPGSIAPLTRFIRHLGVAREELARCLMELLSDGARNPRTPDT